jgi:hypothetical protein
MSETALPSRSAVTSARVSPPAGAAGCAGRAGDQPGARLQAIGGEELGGVDPHVGRVGQVPVAIVEGELGRLHEDVDVVGLR